MALPGFSKTRNAPVPKAAGYPSAMATSPRTFISVMAVMTLTSASTEATLGE